MESKFFSEYLQAFQSKSTHHQAKEQRATMEKISGSIVESAMDQVSSILPN
jgi:hypothetical protein